MTDPPVSVHFVEIFDARRPKLKYESGEAKTESCWNGILLGPSSFKIGVSETLHAA